MRIACLHVPQFALQCVTRTDPSLRGAPIVVVGVDASARPIVQACSRAAWALGARVGMTATAARSLAPELVVVSADAVRERETVRAIADVLLGLAPVVDVGGRLGPSAAHLAMYCEVPGKTRGTTFGDRVIEKLETLGLTARVGIADDRFTAWVAASAPDRASRDDDSGALSVPRGGSAAFLAPRPLSLLSISIEVQHMLEALGVKTLGEFAALPAPSVARPIEADYQALARGDSGSSLRPYAPEAPIREEVAVTDGIAVALTTLSERLALRLDGRGRGAARLEMIASGASGERTIAIDQPRAQTRSINALLGPRPSVLATPDAIAEVLSSALGEAGDTWRLRVSVTGEALAGDDATAAPVEAESVPAIVDTLSLVLSNAGGSLDLAFGPAAPLRATGERRHARMRRGKQRARVSSMIQPKLFKI